MVAVWAVVTENLPALLSHSDIVLTKALGQDSVVDVAVCITKQKNLFPGSFPDCQLLPKVVNKDLPRAPIIAHAPKVASVLVVDCL